MNKIILMGRLTRDPEVRYGGANNTAVARFSIAVDRRFKREGEPTADFFNITAFGRLGEFSEKYLKKGTKVVLDGELRNDNYTNKDGQKVYGMQIIANNIEFAESKAASQSNAGSMPVDNSSAPASQSTTGDAGDGFMSIPDGIVDELPFG
ncbi:MAG: single-stranded DNA-binding protein [Lachnospiraceae bacterium]|nr:single-stranded DNA-binding protein [Lachnospiraceae bacterium]